jgi:hypothetical protein
MSANPIKFILSPEAYFPEKNGFNLFEEENTEVPSETEAGQNIRADQGGIPLILGALAGLTLGGLFCFRQLYGGLMELGESSEEIFRGQQLPFLKFSRREG